MEQKKTEGMRLNKYLAGCGICSRREADRLITEGKVSVDGRPAETGMLVTGEETILVDGKCITLQEKKVVLLYNKPCGVVCTERDEHAERIVTQEIDYPVRVTYAGRLDKDSSGLLILTNDGDLIDRMMRARNGHEKEYHVNVNRPVTDTFIRQMEQGVLLRELGITTRRCKVQKTGEKSFSIILTQGVNRQIRRMCKELGYHVTALKRVRVVTLTLGSLKEGQYREATAQEIAELDRALMKQGDKGEHHGS